MAMTWMETIQLLGLDLLALTLVALVMLHVVEHALHSAWATVRSRQPSAPNVATVRHHSIGGIKHV